MKISLIAIGHSKNSFYLPLIREYEKRINWPCAIIEIKNSKSPDIKIAQSRETQEIIKSIPSDSFNIALDIGGTSYNSPQFAKFLQKNQDHKNICFVIGGAYGYDEGLLAPYVHHRLSFGSATWPHLLVRVMLLEQIYRAQQIIANHPYHH